MTEAIMSTLLNKPQLMIIPIILIVTSIYLIVSTLPHTNKAPKSAVFVKILTICIIAGLVTITAGSVFFFQNHSIANPKPTLNSTNLAINEHNNASAQPSAPTKPPARGDKIYLRLFKQEGILEMWYQHNNQPYQLYKTWNICTYSGGLGPKKAEGDGKSPEGFYATEKNLLKPNSNYHLAFNIGYPNAYDRANGYTGSYIMIHGKCVSIGCYAMNDKNIEQIYAFVSGALDNGQKQIPIHIFPFKMTQANMKKYQHSTYLPFWQELKPAYDIFQSQKRLPSITVNNQHYVIK